MVGLQDTTTTTTDEQRRRFELLDPIEDHAVRASTWVTALEQLVDAMSDEMIDMPQTAREGRRKIALAAIVGELRREVDAAAAAAARALEAA